MFDNEPYFVDHARGDNDNISLRMYKVPTQADRHITVALNDPKLSVVFKLGYLNADHICYYVTRTPTRRYKQGLNNENVHVQAAPIGTGMRVNWNSIYNAPGCITMLKGVYPKFPDAVKNLDQWKGHVTEPISAFDRRFAVSLDQFRKDYIIHYRGAKIAFGQPDGIRLPEEFWYLKEQLVEKGVRVITK